MRADLLGVATSGSAFDALSGLGALPIREPPQTRPAAPTVAAPGAGAESSGWDTDREGWLQAALAELDRVWGPSVLSHEPAADGRRCTVVVDLVPAGEPFAADLLNAVADRLPDTMPVGARLHRGVDMLTVVLPRWDHADAGAWMRTSLPGLFAQLATDGRQAGVALRASVHDADGPAGAQLVQRLDVRPARPGDAVRRASGRHDAAGRTSLRDDPTPTASRHSRRRRPDLTAASTSAPAALDPYGAHPLADDLAAPSGREWPGFTGVGADARAVAGPPASSTARRAGVGSHRAVVDLPGSGALQAGPATIGYDTGTGTGTGSALGLGLAGLTNDARTNDARTDDAPTDDAPTDDAPTDDAPTNDADSASHLERPTSSAPDGTDRSGGSRVSIAAETEGLGIADLLAGALAAYRGW